MPNKAGGQGFTLIETLVVIVIIGSLLSFVYISSSGYLEAVKLEAAVRQITSDLRSSQNKAKSEHSSCRLEFRGNSYSINSAKTFTLPGKITVNTITIIFSPSGSPPPGGSGTLLVSGKNNSRKIIVSPAGRIRIER